MHLPRLSLSTNLLVPLALIGGVAVVLVLAAARFYQDLALEDRKHSVRRMTGILIEQQLEQLRFNAADLGLSLQHEPDFREGLRAEDHAALRFLLNDQFHRYFATADLIRLEKVMVFDRALQPLEESDEGTRLARSRLCPGILERARRRTGPARLKPIDELCLLAGRPYQVVLVPIGGFELNGYLAVVSDPSHNLRDLDRLLGLPTQISLPDGEVLFASPGWPTADTARQRMVVHYELMTRERRSALTVSVAEDIGGLLAKLHHTDYLLMLLACLVSLAAMTLGHALMRANLLQPLRLLTGQMRLTHEDRRRLRRPLAVRGARELERLATDVNTLTGELAELHRRLDEVADKDDLAELPNRVLFHDRLEQLTQLSRRQQSGFALMMVALDQAGAVNERLGHGAGDALLREAAERLSGVLRRSDSVIDPEGDSLARIGGDEFAVILPGVRTPEQASVVANKLLQTLSVPFAVLEQRVEVSTSIGVALFPRHGHDGSTLVRCADQAMLEANRSGRGFLLARCGAG